MVVISVLALCGFVCCEGLSAGEGQLEFQWRFMFDRDVSAMDVGTLYGQNVVVVALGNQYTILSEEGISVSNGTLPSSGSIYSVLIADSDSDGENEVIFGVGEIRTYDINLNKQYPPPEGIPEETDLLYRTLESRGELYVLDGTSLNNFDEVNHWVRSLFVTDVDGDKVDETVAVCGGYMNRYYKKYTEVVYEKEICVTESEIVSTDLDGEECDSTEDAFWDKVKKKCYLNVTWDECGWNYSEKSDVNTHVFIYGPDGDLEYDTNLSGVSARFINAAVNDLFHDENKEIVFGVNDTIYILSYNGSLLFSYPASQGDIREVYVSDFNANGNSDILFDFMNASNKKYCLRVLSRMGVEVWTYAFNSTQKPSAMYSRTLEKDGINEILVFSEGVLYVIGSTGNLEWTASFIYDGLLIPRAERIFASDFDGDGLENILVVSKKWLYNFEVADSFIKEMSAKSNFDMGQKFYEQNRYVQAKTYFESAKQVYSEIGESEGVLRCNAILSELNEKITVEQKLDGDSFYAKALTYLISEDYAAVEEYTLKAKEVYVAIGDPDGIKRCDDLLESILEYLSSEQVNSASTKPLLVTTSLLRSSGGYVSGKNSGLAKTLSENMGYLLVLIVTLLLSFVVLKRKKQKKATKGHLTVKESVGLGGKKTLEVDLGNSKTLVQSGIKNDLDDISGIIDEISESDKSLMSKDLSEVLEETGKEVSE